MSWPSGAVRHREAASYGAQGTRLHDMIGARSLPGVVRGT